MKKLKHGLVFQCCTAMIAAGCLAFLVLFIWVSFLWVAQDFNQALHCVQRLRQQERTLVGELRSVSLNAQTWLSKPFKNTWQQLAHGAQKSSRQIHELLSTPLNDLEHGLKKDNSSLIASGLVLTLTTFLRQVYLIGWTCLQVVLLKALLCLMAAPLFVLMGVAGLIDGLNQRAIRTASLGRESTYVFHKTLPLARKTLAWVLLVWLALPFEFNPQGLFVGLSVLLAVVMSVSASRFKKYL